MDTANPNGQATTTPVRTLLLPGWLDSGPGHWQTLWETRFGDERVVQDDWLWPRRGDWMARLDEVIQTDPRPAILIAHSLGCLLTAAWAGHSAHRQRVLGALVVAPPDTTRADTPPQLHGWRRVERATLPFPAVVLYSSNDPYASAEFAVTLARDWGATAVDCGLRGHLNHESGLGDWPAGREALAALIGRVGGS